MMYSKMLSLPVVKNDVNSLLSVWALSDKNKTEIGLFS